MSPLFFLTQFFYFITFDASAVQVNDTKSSRYGSKLTFGLAGQPSLSR